MKPVARHDRVRVPDGRIGQVIGFYRRAVESVLVSFAPGDAREFLLPEVEPIGGEASPWHRPWS